MDSSKIAALGSPKPPSIASRRPMLSSQRSFSVLSINTNTTHGDMMRRNSSATTANRHRRLQTPTVIPPLPLSANNNNNNSMSPEELSSKIADSFQQFSSMLSQLSSNKATSTTPSTTTPVTPPIFNPIHPANTKNARSNNIPSQPNPQQLQQPQKPQKQQVDSLNSPPLSTFKLPSPIATQNNHRKEIRISSHPTNLHPNTIPLTRQIEIENQLPQVKKLSESENESEEEKENIDEGHAIYFGNITAVINEGDTKLRRRLISKCLIRAASIGDLDAMQLMFDSIQDIDVNFTSDKKTGITCLMYASYFGHVDCLNLLLKHKSIRINQQDKKGWTALMWAINSHKTEIVQILLAHGAKKSLETRNNRTVFNFPTTSSMKELLGEPSIDQVKVPCNNNEPLNITEVLVERNKRDSNSSTMSEMEYYAVDGYNHFLNSQNTTAVDPRKKSTLPVANTPLPPDLSQLTKIITSPQQEQRIKENSIMNTPTNGNIMEEEQDIKRWETSIKSSNTFSWDQCLPDQMFVFSQDDMSFLIDQALNVPDIKSLMNKSQLSNELWQPANIIFLSARFAHYCSSRDLLNLFLTTVAARLTKVIKSSYRDIHALAYWIANICQLSSYLKKDPGLSVCTHDAQETLSELISEAYSCLIIESQKKIEKILESSMLEYESIHELEQVEFVDDWQRFFRRSSSNNSRKSTDTASSIERKPSMDFNNISSASLTHSNESLSSSTTSLSPQSITKLLTYIQTTLQAYHVPPAIEIQAIAQFFHYLSCELFNRVLAYKKYLCRSKALQLRMNLSEMEEWVRINHLPPSLNNSFEPLIQLLQLLQCLSQMNEVLLFSSTVQTFDKLNPLQLKRCVQNYRYEVSEPRLPEVVEQLTNQMVHDYQQQLILTGVNRKNNAIHTRLSMDSIGINNTTTLSKVAGGGRPASISSLNCLLTTTTNKKRLSSEEIMSINNTMIQQLDDEEDEREEKRNSKYLLPFSIPVTTALLQGWSEEKYKKSITTSSKNNYSDAIYQEIKLKKQEQFNLLDKIYPVIAEEWIYNLDKRLHTR